jgi:hypothetical protein
MGNWPDDARPAHYGQRAEKIQKILLSAAAAVSPPDTQDR